MRQVQRTAGAGGKLCAAACSKQNIDSGSVWAPSSCPTNTTTQNPPAALGYPRAEQPAQLVADRGNQGCPRGCMEIFSFQGGQNQHGATRCRGRSCLLALHCTALQPGSIYLSLTHSPAVKSKSVPQRLVRAQRAAPHNTPPSQPQTCCDGQGTPKQGQG